MLDIPVIDNRVAIFCASISGGGAERVIVNLASSLAKRGIAVDLLVADAKGPLLLELPSGVNLIDLEAHRLLACIPGLVRYLRKVRPKVLFSAMDYVNVVAVWAKFLSGISTRVVVSVHAQPEYFYGNRSTLRGRILIILLRLSYLKADKVVAVSRGLANELVDLVGINKNKVCTIYNPIINDELYHLSKEIFLHPSIGLHKPPIILAVGRLAIEKDYPTLIRAFQLVRQQRTARLLILGEGEERVTIENLIKTLNLTDDVDLLGFVRNPYALMKVASCFVLSSKSEGFGNVLVEALAIGCPIVSTNCPYGPGEILVNGKWGALVPVGDYSAMANSILTALDGNHNSNSPSLYSHLEQFRISVIVENYFHVLFPK